MKKWVFLLMICMVSQIVLSQTCTNNLVTGGDFTTDNDFDKEYYGTILRTGANYLEIDDPTLQGNSIGNCYIVDWFTPYYWHGNWHNGTGENGDINFSTNHNHFLMCDIPAPKTKITVWEQEIEVNDERFFDLSFKVANIEVLNLNQTHDDPIIGVEIIDANGEQTVINKTDITASGALAKTNPSTDPWKINWTTITKKEIVAQPYMKKTSDGVKKYITLRISAFDTEQVGFDLGLDDICLTSPYIDGYITAQAKCINDDIGAAFSGAHSSITRWEIDNTSYTGQQSTTFNIDAATHKLKAGPHLIKCVYEDLANVEQVSYFVINLIDPSSYESQLKYKWDLTGTLPLLKLSSVNYGQTLEYWRYTDENKTTGDQITTINAGYYEADMNCKVDLSTPANNYYHVCKETDYGCYTATSNFTLCENLCPPTTCDANITASTPVLKSNGNYEITFSGSFNLPHNPTFEWAFGDGTYTNGVGQTSITHEFHNLGSFHVCLIASTDKGCTYSTCQTVIICPQVDQDELVGTATCFGTAPSTLDADPDNDDPTGTTYEWWFNNENVGTSKTLTLSVSDFPRPGSFTVEVRKTTNCQVYIETATIEIEKPEPVDFSFSRPQKQPFRSSSF